LESLFVEDVPQEDSLLDLERSQWSVATPASVPSLPWSNLDLSSESTATDVTETLLTTYRDPQFDKSLLIPSFQNLSLENVRLLYEPNGKRLPTADTSADEIFHFEIN